MTNFSTQAAVRPSKHHRMPRQGRNRRFALLQNYVGPLATAVALQSLLTLFAGLHPLFELAAHGSMHALVLAGLLLPIAVLLRQARALITLGLALCVLLPVTRPWDLWLAASPAFSARENSLKILSWNLLSRNQSLQEMEALIRRVDPDVLVLIEVRPGLLESMESLAGTYPISISRPAWGGEGIAVLSRVAGTQLTVQDFDYPHQPAVLAAIPSATSAAVLQLVAMHALSPIPIFRTSIRNRQLSAMLEWSRDRQEPICVCGDFNVTPWTPVFRSILDGGFRDSRRGVGNCATWPGYLGAWGIPIDHALTRGRCHISERQVLADAHGSDHLPILFTLHF